MKDRSNPGTKNLIRIGELPEEQQRKMRQMAGKASGAARRRKRDLKNLCQTLMDSQITDQKTRETVVKYFPNLTDDDLDYATAMIYAQIKKAIEGDSKAFELVRDTSGQRPTDKKDITSSDGSMTPPTKIELVYPDISDDD